MIFKTKNKNVQHKITVNIADQNIKQVDHKKFFGVYLDEKLCWKFRINHVSIKVSKTAGIIAKGRYYLEHKNLKELYNTMVYPYLTYCNINWASTYPTRLRSIYIAQKKISKTHNFFKFSRNFSAFVQDIKNNEYI